MSIELIHGACPHDCPDTCGVITEVENGHAVRFYADPGHPVTQGWLCAKAVSYTHLRAHETVLDLVCRLLLEKNITPDSNLTHII